MAGSADRYQYLLIEEVELSILKAHIQYQPVSQDNGI